MGKLDRYEILSPTNELHSLGQCRGYWFWREHLKCAGEKTPASPGSSVMSGERLLGAAWGSLAMRFQGLWQSEGQVMVLREHNYYSA